MSNKTWVLLFFPILAYSQLHVSYNGAGTSCTHCFKCAFVLRGCVPKTDLGLRQDFSYLSQFKKGLNGISLEVVIININKLPLFLSRQLVGLKIVIILTTSRNRPLLCHFWETVSKCCFCTLNEERVKKESAFETTCK